MKETPERRQFTRNKTGFRGISIYNDRDKKFRARIYRKRVLVRDLGYFYTLEAAAAAYDDAMREAFGDGARVNLPAADDVKINAGKCGHLPDRLYFFKRENRFTCRECNRLAAATLKDRKCVAFTGKAAGVPAQ